MALKLMYITNDTRVANIAENCDVDWIFIDLEINGKDERQGHLDTVISRHHIDDVKKIKTVLHKSELLVRVNPIFEGSQVEIDRVIQDGADIVMLPYFKTKREAAAFLKIVNGRAKTCLLVETPEAVEQLDDILSLNGIDYIHVGLNDLHLGYNMAFLFEPLADGTVEMICEKVKARGIEYGFGGIAQLGKGDLPAENVITEHYRLGSSMVILSRSFCNLNKIQSVDEAKTLFDEGTAKIRDFEQKLQRKDENYFEYNRLVTKNKIIEIVNQILAISSN